MRTSLFFCSLFLLTALWCSGQDLSGTWHGFQVSREYGYTEYRITMDFKLSGKDQVTGTMQLKSPQKGIITSNFSGTLDKKENTLYLKEESITTGGITSADALLCSYVLKLHNNRMKGTGRSRAKGYDHLQLHLERSGSY